MELALKNITPALVIDALACPFEAELFINGKPTAFVSFNPSQPEPQLVPMTMDDTAQIAAAEQYCHQQAMAAKAMTKTAASEIKESLSLTLDRMVQAHFEEINRQTSETLRDARSRYAILYGNTKSSLYRYHCLSQSVASYLASPQGQKQLVKILKTEVAHKLHPDDSILNLDIPVRILLDAFGGEKTQPPARKRVAQAATRQRKKP